MLYDYTSVTPASVAAEAEAGIDAAEDLLAAIVAVTDRTWETTMAPLDAIGDTLVRAGGRSDFLGRVHPDEEVRVAGARAEELLTKWSVDLSFREDLYRAVRAYAETPEAAALEGERRRLLDFWLRDFRRAGHELSAEDRAEVQRLRGRLVELKVAFQRNLDEYRDALELTREELAGLPDAFVAGLEAGAEPGTHRVSLDYPEYVPFMQNAVQRDLRRSLAFKRNTRAVEANRPLITEAIDIRRRLAALLGYPTWAHFSMEVKMARDPGAVEQFYKDLLPGLQRLAQDEYAAMTAILAEDHPGDPLQPWDTAFLDNQQRKRDFGVDQLAVAEYFPLDDVVDGMFRLTGEVFGLEYRRVPDARAWHPDVVLYEIREAGGDKPIAWFYADLFPREGKYTHAAAFDLVKGRAGGQGYQRPVAAIVANFTKPTADQPSLLKHDEVSTLFHEFGHVLHMCLTRAESARFSGAETEWDFVEAPSQIMEHWTWQADVLARFARHHATGEPIPADLVDRLVAARNLNEAGFTLRQMYYGKLDLALHSAREVGDLAALDRETFAVTGLPFHEGTFMLAGFDHVMGGYDAGYYGYLWSKVFGDDMFSVFEAEGVTSPVVGRRYREAVLEPGGSRDGNDLLRSFLRREPSNESFLRHLGLTTSTPA